MNDPSLTFLHLDTLFVWWIFPLLHEAMSVLYCTQKKTPISYNIFFCGTSSTSAAEEEAPATEEDTIAHMGKGLLLNYDTLLGGFNTPPPFWCVWYTAKNGQ